MAPFIGGSLNPILDSIFCATLLLHSHIGFEYVPLPYLNPEDVAICFTDQNIIGHVLRITSQATESQASKSFWSGF